MIRRHQNICELRRMPMQGLQTTCYDNTLQGFRERNNLNDSMPLTQFYPQQGKTT